MDVSLAEIENLFVNSSYTRAEIIRIFRAYEKANRPSRGSVLEAALEVAEDWKTVMEEPRAIFDAKRIKLIKRALENYTVDDLKLVNRGCCLSPWHMGTDPNNTTGQIVNWPELLYKDPEHIERFRGIAISQNIEPDAEIRKSDFDGTKPQQVSEYTEFVPNKRI